MTNEKTWWRHTWMEAVYTSDLTPQERLIAAIYADHAWNARMTWVTITRLAQRAGMSERQARQWRSSLIEKKWLIEMEKARQHKAAVYFLSIPEGYEVPIAKAPNKGLDEIPEAVSGWTGATGLDSPRAEAGRRSDETRAEAERRQGGGSASSGRRLAAATPSSYQSSHPSSSSRLTQRAQLAQRITGLDEEDELLQYVDDLLKEKNVSRAKAWMVKCHEAGDLIPMLEALKPETGIWATKNYRNYDEDDDSETGEWATYKRQEREALRGGGCQEGCCTPEPRDPNVHDLVSGLARKKGMPA